MCRGRGSGRIVKNRQNSRQRQRKAAWTKLRLFVSVQAVERFEGEKRIREALIAVATQEDG